MSIEVEFVLVEALYALAPALVVCAGLGLELERSVVAVERAQAPRVGSPLDLLAVSGSEG